MQLELQTRIDRLAAGRGTPADLTRIFTGLRSGARSGTSFREIADAVAHPDFRDQGLLTTHVRDLVQMMDVIGRSFINDPLDDTPFPGLAAARKSAWAQSRLVRRQIRDELGLTDNQIETSLAKGLKKVISFDGWNLTYSRPLKDREQKVINEIFHSLRFPSPENFDLPEIAENFADTLGAAGYNLGDRERFIDTTKRGLAAFIIAHMDGMLLDAKHRKEVRIRADFSDEQAKITVLWPAPVTPDSGIVFTVLETGIATAEIFDASALRAIRLVERRPLELTEDLRIRALE